MFFIKNAPNFYFLPTLYHDVIFDEYDTGGWYCPKWMEDHGYDVIKLTECEEEEAEYWWVLRERRGLFDKESADAAKSLGKTVIALKKGE